MKIKLAVPDSKIIKNEENYISGLYVAKPVKRDNLERPAVTVDLSKKVVKEKTIRQIEE